MSESQGVILHGTTILAVRKGDRVVIAGDGQVSLGNTVLKANARKVRRIGRMASSSPGLPARPPTPSPCSNAWKPSWSNIRGS